MVASLARVWALAIAVVVTASVTCGMPASEAGEPPLSRETQAPRDRASATAQPHILFVVADDLGWHDVGFRGTRIRTPTIDALAAGGAVLDNYYVQPVCTPSRASFMTGRYPIRYGLQHYVIEDGCNYGVPLNETLLPEALKAAGYKTHAIGKWHLGMYDWEHTPTFRGFDSFHGYYNGGEDYYTHMTDGGYDFRIDHGSNCGAGCSQVAWDEQGNYSTLVFTSAAENIINAHDASTPMFMYLAYQAVHSPVEVPAKYSDPYTGVIQDKQRRLFAGMLTAMDEGIGNITAALKARGMWDNTLVVFTSDNGGPIKGSSRCHICGDNTGSENTPLRGGKHSLWEGGVRATSVVYGAGVTKTGYNNSGFMHATDWIQTIAHAAGALPELQRLTRFPLDGMDMYDVVTTGAPSPRKSVLLNYDTAHNINGPKLINGTGDAALRSADGMKLLVGDPGPPDVWSHQVSARNPSGDQQGLGAQRVGLTRAELFRLMGQHDDGSRWPFFLASAVSDDARVLGIRNGTVQLFNVTADPSELHEISAAHPDIVAALLDELDTYAKAAAPIAFCFDDASYDASGATGAHHDDDGARVTPAPGKLARCADPASLPSKHGGAWTPWVAAGSV